MSRSRYQPARRVVPNLTPLIDLAFLLIVFFVLCSQINAVENMPLDLPRPKASAALAPGDEPRVVVNVVPAQAGAAAAYRLGKLEFPPTPEGVSALANTIAGTMRVQPATEINVRADRGTEFRWVRPVLEAVSNALVDSGIPRDRARVKLVVLGETAS